MMNDDYDKSTVFTLEINWFQKVLDQKIKLFFNQGAEVDNIYELSPPDLSSFSTCYSDFVRDYKLSFKERIIFILTLLPHVNATILSGLYSMQYDSCYTDFGIVDSQEFGKLMPTCQTVLFLLTASDLEERLTFIRWLQNDMVLFKNGIVRINSSGVSGSFANGIVTVSNKYLSKLMSISSAKLHYSSNFPARLISTSLDWYDTVLELQTLSEIEKIIAWHQYSEVISQNWNLVKALKPGYRCLFYGPPGTGKTLTVQLIGKDLDLEVYRVDLSMLVSKYIGETEKNLANLFDIAIDNNWLLFFDEADALFSARNGGNSANDKHANQEIAYLLQRIEDFPGLVILATNLRTNIDDAFYRRFQSLVYFPMPSYEIRLMIWKKYLNHNVDKNIDIEKIAEEYELSGGAIINVLRYAAICAWQDRNELITQKNLEVSIRHELQKSGKVILN
ncbi:ATP-binding protein [Zooshikella sp. RANM57]|uniref:ATP-binding protein n=1 Tax=Zooshikella sp. RANM57 TaxID=3425863 RepID=UPI003D6FB0D5